METEKQYTATEISELRYDAYLMGRNEEYKKSMKIIKTQSKIITLMARYIMYKVPFTKETRCLELKEGARSLNSVIQYFEKKAEEVQNK